MQLLDGPAVVDEPGGEPIEQLGMRGLLAHDAEVARRADQAFAEVMLPDAVHDHARRQRIIGAGQPFGAASGGAGWFAAAAGNAGWVGASTAGTAGLDLRTGRGRLAADQQERGEAPWIRLVEVIAARQVRRAPVAARRFAPRRSASLTSSFCFFQRFDLPGLCRARLEPDRARRSADPAPCVPFAAARRPIEDRHHAVVVARRQGLELVVVAAGAARASAPERPATWC